MDNGKLRAYLDTKPLGGAHAVRGVGSYTRSLIDSLKSNEEIELVEEVGKSDIIHYPYFDLFFVTLPLKKQKPTVVTIHDVIPLIYPKYYKPGIRGRLKLEVQKLSLKNVDAVITDSETSKKDIVRLLDVSQEKIYVVHLAPGKEFKRIVNTTALRSTVVKYGLPKKFILYVGDVNYNKNIEGLINAFAMINSKLKVQNFGLVLIGEAFNNKDLSETKGIFQLIEKLNIGEQVLMPGFVLPEDLVYLYNLATVYCQPSFYEGFGLPILEAMACGCPVVATKTQALVEISKNAASFADPKNPEDLANKLREVIDDKNLRNLLIRKGIEHVKNFSWERVAEKTTDVYRSVAG